MSDGIFHGMSNGVSDGTSDGVFDQNFDFRFRVEEEGKEEQPRKSGRFRAPEEQLWRLSREQATAYAHLCSQSYTLLADSTTVTSPFYGIQDGQTVHVPEQHDFGYLALAGLQSQVYVIAPKEAAEDGTRTITVVFSGTTSLQGLYGAYSFDQTGWHSEEPGDVPVVWGGRFSILPCDAVRVHRGYKRGYDISKRRLWKLLQDFGLASDDTLVITGHSLGGAMAQMCALDIRQTHRHRRIEVVTFGSPAVGNENFQALYDAELRNATVSCFQMHACAHVSMQCMIGALFQRHRCG